jgi:hypothetical protein
MATTILSLAGVVVAMATWGWTCDLLSWLFSNEEARLAEWRRQNAILREKGRNL